jgi:hypothetical protein
MGFSRRSVLVGAGGLAVGGGVLLGSGAFSSVEADRDVEVNVLVEDEIGDDDQVADVLVDVGRYNGVAVDAGSGENTDGSGLFPDSSTYSVSNGPTSTYGTSWVSVINNDVTIIFGPSGNELPPNAVVGFDNLFALVNTSGSQTAGSHTLAFDNGDFTATSTELSFTSPPSGLQVNGNTGVEYNTDVNTGNSSDTASAALQITIN